MSTDVGKVFETELEAVFNSLKESHLLGWHRLPDTHSAGGGNIIQPQPSDYILGLPPTASVPTKKRGTNPQRLIFFEAKATEKYETLQKSAVKPDQRGFIHFYCGLLGIPYVICHYSSVTGNLQMWNGMAISENRLKKESHLLAEFSAGVGRKLNRDKCSLAFIEFFSLPEKLKTVKLYNQST